MGMWVAVQTKKGWELGLRRDCGDISWIKNVFFQKKEDVGRALKSGCDYAPIIGGHNPGKLDDST